MKNYHYRRKNRDWWRPDGQAEIGMLVGWGAPGRITGNLRETVGMSRGIVKGIIKKGTHVQVLVEWINPDSIRGLLLVWQEEEA